MDGEVTVSFEGREHRVDIEDVNPEDLRDLFGIDFDVKSLLEVETEKTVLIKKKEKLKAGFTYVLQRPAQTLSPDSPQVIPPLWCSFTLSHFTLPLPLLTLFLYRC